MEYLGLGLSLFFGLSGIAYSIVILSKSVDKLAKAWLDGCDDCIEEQHSKGLHERI